MSMATGNNVSCQLLFNFLIFLFIIHSSTNTIHPYFKIDKCLHTCDLLEIHFGCQPCILEVTATQIQKNNTCGYFEARYLFDTLGELPWHILNRLGCIRYVEGINKIRKWFALIKLFRRF